MLSKEDVAEILRKHLLWLRDEPDGSRANLSGANLSGADLRGANLIVADLRGANLRGANLSGANLSGADLIGANLNGADLRGANLRGANLRGADLSGADLNWTDLSEADLSGADLNWTDLSGADLIGADIPIIPDLDRRILAAIEAGGVLKMDAWHTCETTHCRAGWAVTVAGEPGLALERAVGTPCAAALMYAAIRPEERVPDFYASDAAAMADIRRIAALATT